MRILSVRPPRRPPPWPYPTPNQALKATKKVSFSFVSKRFGNELTKRCEDLRPNKLVRIECTWEGNTKFVHVAAHENIRALRRKLGRKLGVPKCQVSLKCGLRYLYNENLISAINATVHAMPCNGLAGGMHRGIRGPGASSIGLPRALHPLPILLVPPQTPITGGGSSDAEIAANDVVACATCRMPAPEFSIMHPGNQEAGEDPFALFGCGFRGGTCGKRFPGNRQDKNTIQKHQLSSVCCSVQRFTDIMTKDKDSGRTEPKPRLKPPLIQDFNDKVMGMTAEHGLKKTPENGWEVPLAMLKEGTLRPVFLNLLVEISRNRGKDAKGDPTKGFIGSGSEQYQGLILAGACQPPPSERCAASRHVTFAAPFWPSWRMPPHLSLCTHSKRHNAAACAALLNNEMWGEPNVTVFLNLVVAEMQLHGSSALGYLKESTATRVFNQIASAVDHLGQSVAANTKRTLEQVESLVNVQV